MVRLASALNVRVGWLLGEPSLILEKEDREMLQTVLGIMDKIIEAHDAGKSITIVPPGKG